MTFEELLKQADPLLEIGDNKIYIVNVSNVFDAPSILVQKYIPQYNTYVPVMTLKQIGDRICFINGTEYAKASDDILAKLKQELHTQ